MPRTVEDAYAEVEKENDGLRAENERLREALLSVPCPGGGFTGMPKDAEANVALCIKHGVCGCQYGDALRANEQDGDGCCLGLTPEECAKVPGRQCDGNK